MRGALTILLGLTLFLVFAHTTPVPNLATPVPKQDSFFPVEIGTRWVYDWRRPADDGPPAREIVEVVIDVERKRETTFVIFGQIMKDGKVDCPYVMAVSDEGLHYGVNNAWTGPNRDRLYSYFNWELKQPWLIGDTWESDNVHGDSTHKTKYTNCGAEQVKVPAGEYYAVKVSSDRLCRDGTRERRTAWYAQGVGKVKCVDESGWEIVLKSFSAGRD